MTKCTYTSNIIKIISEDINKVYITNTLDFPLNIVTKEIWKLLGNFSVWVELKYNKYLQPE